MEKANLRPSASPTEEQKGIGYTPEKASLPETKTQDNQWQETDDASQYEPRGADGSNWD